MFQLMKAEVVKELYKKSTIFFIMSILLLAILHVVILPAFISDEESVTFEKDHWQGQVEQEIKERSQENKDIMNEYGEDIPFGESITLDLNHSQIERLTYHLENNIQPPSTNNLFESLVGLPVFNILIALIAVVIASNMVPKEFNMGTIKLLLIRPYTRMELLLSKYLATILFATGLLILLYISALILGFIFTDMNPTQQLVLQTSEGLIHVNFWKYFLGLFGSSLFFIFVITNLAFAMGVITFSSKISLGLSMLLLVGGSPIIMYLSGKTELTRYLLMANWNLAQYLPDQTPTFSEMTLPFSIVVSLLYVALFLFLSFYTFNKRDIHH